MRRTDRLSAVAAGINPGFAEWIKSRREAFDKFELLVLRGWLACKHRASADELAKAVRAAGISLDNSQVRNMARLFSRLWPQCAGVFTFKRVVA